MCNGVGQVLPRANASVLHQYLSTIAKRYHNCPLTHGGLVPLYRTVSGVLMQLLARGIRGDTCRKHRLLGVRTVRRVVSAPLSREV